MRESRGHGLLLALVVVVVMMMAVGLLASSMGRGMREVRRELATVSRIALTDAAMAETLAYLAQDDLFGGIPERPLGGGSMSSRVRRLGQKRVEIVVRATHAGRQRELRAVVRLTISGPRVLGLLP